MPTGIPPLDGLLGGGFPCGTLVTLEGSAGRWSIAGRLVAAVTQRSLAAIIDDGGLYPPGLARAGALLDRVMIVAAPAPLNAARAADVLLRSRTCRLVLMPAAGLQTAIWNRLASLAHRTGAVLIVVAANAAVPLAAAAGLRLHCTRERLVVEGTPGPWCTFAGYDLRAHVRKSKRALTALSARFQATDAALY